MGAEVVSEFDAGEMWSVLFDAENSRRCKHVLSGFVLLDSEATIGPSCLVSPDNTNSFMLDT